MTSPGCFDLELAEAKQARMAQWARPWGNPSCSGRSLAVDSVAVAVRARGHWHTAIMDKRATDMLTQTASLLAHTPADPQPWIDRLGERLQAVWPDFTWAQPPVAHARWRVPFDAGLLIVDFDRKRLWSHQEWSWLSDRLHGQRARWNGWDLDEVLPGRPEAMAWVRRLLPSLSDAERHGWREWVASKPGNMQELARCLNQAAPPRLQSPVFLRPRL